MESRHGLHETCPNYNELAAEIPLLELIFRRDELHGHSVSCVVS